MFPKWHILSGAIFALFLYLFFKLSLLNSLIVFLASVFIDVDHYFYYIYRKRNLNLKKSYLWFINLDKKYMSMPDRKRKKYYYGFIIFHGIEPFLIFFLLSLIPQLSFLFFITLGFLMHICQDFVFKIYRKEDPFGVLSLIYNKISNKDKKNLESIM